MNETHFAPVRSAPVSRPRRPSPPSFGAGLLTAPPHPEPYEGLDGQSVGP